MDGWAMMGIISGFLSYAITGKFSLEYSKLMIGNLDPEENVMDDTLATAKRKAIAICNQGVSEKLLETIAELGWDCYDNIAVEIGGTSVYEIEGAGTKWAPVKGTRKYNKDAFIVIKNLDRNPTVQITTKP